MTVTIASELVHQPEQGDGIRVFIVSSRAGVLASTHIHHDTLDLNADSIVVEAGEIVDFIVDIGDVLNSDQYLWEVSLTEQLAEGVEASGQVTTWNSREDFPMTTAQQLTPIEQLAQLLLCSNEFVFVD